MYEFIQFIKKAFIKVFDSRKSLSPLTRVTDGVERHALYL